MQQHRRWLVAVALGCLCLLYVILNPTTPDRSGKIASVFTDLSNVTIVNLYVYRAHVYTNLTILIAVGPCLEQESALVELPASVGGNGRFWHLQRTSDHCPEHQCTHVGYYLTLHGTVNLPPQLTTAVQEPAAGNTRPHRLVACISPLTLFVDWTNLIDFTEVWLQQGMTRLHAYWHSMSTEALAVLLLYAQAGIAVEHAWPSLPHNLSEQLIIYGQLVTYHDCLLLTATESSWTAFMDLDELVYVKQGSLIDYLGAQPPTAGAIQLVSYFSYPSWDRNRTSLNPRQYDISYLAEFEMDDEVRMLPKSIVRPTAVSRLQVHYLVRMLPWFTLVSGEESRQHAFLAHVRKPDRHDRPERVRTWNGLKRVVDSAQLAWQRRRAALPDVDWAWQAIQVTSAVDQCNLQLYNSVDCWSFHRCFPLLNTTDYQLQFAPNGAHSWYPAEAIVRM